MPSRRRDATEPDTRLSKKMSAVLRHRIQENGLGPVLRPDGYVPLAALLAAPGFGGVSEADVRRVVARNDKQRFSLTTGPDGATHIRANQGHSIGGLDDDEMLERLDASSVDTPTRAVHGTSLAAWPAILASGGLSPMSRRHVHLAADLPRSGTGVISGMRASAQVHIWVDVAAAAAAGVPFYRAANGVILTPGAPASGVLPDAYFCRVVDVSGSAPREWDLARACWAQPAEDAEPARSRAAGAGARPGLVTATAAHAAAPRAALHSVDLTVDARR